MENSIFFQSCPYTELRMGDFARTSGRGISHGWQEKTPGSHKKQARQRGNGVEYGKRTEKDFRGKDCSQRGTD